MSRDDNDKIMVLLKLSDFGFMSWVTSDVKCLFSIKTVD